MLPSNALSFFLKCYIDFSFFPKTSNVCLNLVLSILIEVDTNLSPFKRREISDFVNCLYDKLIAFLLKNTPSSLLSLTQHCYH